MNGSVTVAGAGLAGCEAAWQCAEGGAKVRLYEMKPKKFTPAHKNPDFADCGADEGRNAQTRLTPSESSR